MSDHLFTPRKPLKRYHPAVQALVFGFLVVILLLLLIKSHANLDCESLNGSSMTFWEALLLAYFHT